MSGNTASMDGGAILSHGINTIKNVTFSENHSGKRGGALYADGVTTLEQNSFDTNTAVMHGGAVCMKPGINATLTVKSGTFTDNSAIESGGAICAECPFTLEGGDFTGNSAQKNGGAIWNNVSLTIKGGNIGTAQSGNTTTGPGGGVYAEGSVIFTGGTIASNQAANGGGVYLTGTNATFAMSGANATISGNEATGNGGGVYYAGSTFTMTDGTIGGTANKAVDGAGIYVVSGSVEVSGGSVTGNTATGKGGAVFAASGATVNLKEGTTGEGDSAKTTSVTITGNSAKLGGASFVDNGGILNMSAGQITGNSASDANGGAINVGGVDARLNFSGNPVVYGNPATNGQQKNVVLSVDSNGIINTAAESLTGGLLGVYVIDGENASIYKAHGTVNLPFGTFGDEGHANPSVFINDRIPALYGVSKGAEDSKIYWMDPVCKLTDGENALLYKEITLNINGTETKVKVAAVYTSVEEGFADAAKQLYRKNGAVYAANQPIQLKMLKDYALDADEIITFTQNRALTFTTAENSLDARTLADGDVFIYMPVESVMEETNDEAVIQRRTHATLTRAQDTRSMFTIDTGNALTVSNLIFDGGNNAMMTAANVSGGAFDITSATSATFNGVTLKHLNATGNGGAISYTGSAGQLRMTDTIVENCRAAGNGGAVYSTATATTLTNTTIDGKTGSEEVTNAAIGGAVYASGTVTVNGGTIRNCTASTAGGGLFIANGGSLTVGSTTVNSEVNDTTITACKAVSGEDNKIGNGGGIYATGTVTITGSSATGNAAITDCTAGANGGGLYLTKDAALSTNPTSTLDWVSLTGNTAANGGAVYVTENATLALANAGKPSTVTGNTATTAGAGIYLEEGSKLELAGKPDFGGADVVTTEGATKGDILGESGNFVQKKGVAPWIYPTTADAEMPKNGGKAYPTEAETQSYKVRQDIYMAGFASEDSVADSIVVTGAISSDKGSIWVWSDVAAHNYMLKQFAVFGSTLIKTTGAGTSAVQSIDLDEAQLKATLEAFRNAQDDDTTDCGGDFLTGQEGEVKGNIYWTGGFDVIFLKTDSFDAGLAGATFTLYTDEACTTEFQMTFSDGKHATTTSSDGTATYKDKDGVVHTLVIGEVLLSKVAPKTYYMKETVVPDGCADSNKDVVYQVTVSATGVLTLMKKSSTTATTYDYEVYKVQTKAASGTDPAEYQYHVMNLAKAQKKIILKKVAENKTPLEDAHFRIFRADLSEVTDDQPTYKSGDTLPAGKRVGDSKGYYESGTAGAYFIGKMPFGTYYLVEMKEPTGYDGNVGKVLKLIIDGSANAGNIIGDGTNKPVGQLTNAEMATDVNMRNALHDKINSSTTAPAGDTPSP